MVYRHRLEARTKPLEEGIGEKRPPRDAWRPAIQTYRVCLSATARLAWIATGLPLDCCQARPLGCYLTIPQSRDDVAAEGGDGCGQSIHFCGVTDTGRLLGIT